MPAPKNKPSYKTNNVQTLDKIMIWQCFARGETIRQVSEKLQMAGNPGDRKVITAVRDELPTLPEGIVRQYPEDVQALWKDLRDQNRGQSQGQNAEKPRGRILDIFGPLVRQFRPNPHTGPLPAPILVFSATLLSNDDSGKERELMTIVRVIVHDTQPDEIPDIVELIEKWGENPEPPSRPKSGDLILGGGVSRPREHVTPAVAATTFAVLYAVLGYAIEAREDRGEFADRNYIEDAKAMIMQRISDWVSTREDSDVSPLEVGELLMRGFEPGETPQLPQPPKFASDSNTDLPCLEIEQVRQLSLEALAEAGRYLSNEKASDVAKGVLGSLYLARVIVECDQSNTGE